MTGGNYINEQIKNNAIINEKIKASEVLLVADDGEKIGILSREIALEKAYSKELDLVLISEKSQPPIAKIMDYSKFRFEYKKNQRKMKKNQKQVVLQEIRISPTIDKNDFDTKAKNAKRMLEKGNKVKVSLRLYGRMIIHQDIGRDMINKFIESLSSIGNVEDIVKLEGKNLFAIVVPKKK